MFHSGKQVHLFGVLGVCMTRSAGALCGKTYLYQSFVNVQMCKFFSAYLLKPEVYRTLLLLHFPILFHMPLLGGNESIGDMQEAQQVCACQVLNIVSSYLDCVHPPPLVWLAQDGVQVMAATA